MHEENTKQESGDRVVLVVVSLLDRKVKFPENLTLEQRPKGRGRGLGCPGFGGFTNADCGWAWPSFYLLPLPFH